jgi:hypothetical protein
MGHYHARSAGMPLVLKAHRSPKYRQRCGSYTLILRQRTSIQSCREQPRFMFRRKTEGRHRSRQGPEVLSIHYSFQLSSCRACEVRREGKTPTKPTNTSTAESKAPELWRVRERRTRAESAVQPASSLPAALATRSKRYVVKLRYLKLTVIYTLTQSRPRGSEEGIDPVTVRSGPTGREGTRPYGGLLTRRPTTAGSGPEIARRAALRSVAVRCPMGNGENTSGGRWRETKRRPRISARACLTDRGQWFDVQRSTFNVQLSVINVNQSSLKLVLVRHSAFSMRRQQCTYSVHSR